MPPVYNGGIGTISMGKYHRSYSFPANAFTSPMGESLSYSVTGLPFYMTFNSATRTFHLAQLQRVHFTPSVTLTATDTGGRSTSHVVHFDIIGTSPFFVPVGGGAGSHPGQLGQTGQTQHANPTAQAESAVQPETATPPAPPPNIQSYWFTYDADNRVAIDGGDLVDGQIRVVDRRGSVENFYNQAGDKIKELSNDGSPHSVTQRFTYNVRGEETHSTLANGMGEVRQYDQDGRVVADVYTYAQGTTVQYTIPDGTFNLSIAGWLSSATTYYYNPDGTLRAKFDYSRVNADQNYWNSIGIKLNQGTLHAATEKAIPPSIPPLTDAANGAGYGEQDGNGNPVLGQQSHVSHWDPATGTGGYDAEGNALVYSYSGLNSQGQSATTTYHENYLKQDGYLEQSITGTSSDPSVLTTTETSVYDAFGRRVAMDTHSAGQTTDQVRAFAYNPEGEILERRDGSATNGAFTLTANGGYATHHYAYVEGREIGAVDEHGDINVLAGVTGFSNTTAGTRDYVVQAGDTLPSIAQQVYGDASLWYVVADANGFDTATDTPIAGQTLKLPEVTTNRNTAETFRPYNPRQIQGSTTPSLPQAPMPAPSAQHCNTVAEIVVVAAVIVASIYTAGAAAEAFGATGAAAGGSSTFAIGSAALTGGGLVGTGGAALGAEVGIGAAAIGGAAGDAAGQLVGDAEGVHHGFSWGEVAGAGLGAGITAGLAGGISGGESIKHLASAKTWAADARIAGMGAAGAIGSYAGEKLVGEPAHFSWANVAAAALGTEATTALGLNSTLAQQSGQGVDATFAENVVGGLVNGAIDSETARLLGGDAANGRQIVEDAFGNALGNAAVAGIDEANARNEQKQLRASIDQLQATQSAELSASTDAFDAQTGQMAMADIRAAGQSTLDQEYAGTEQALEDRLAAMPDPSLAASIAAINADNQRIVAMQASQSYDAYGTGIHWLSAGEREEAFNTFPNATYGTSLGAGSSDDVVGDYINMMNQVGSYAQAAISGGYAGFQAIPGKMDAAVASVWGDIKSGWAHVSSLNALAGDVLSLNNEIWQLPEQLPQLPGEVQNWATGLGNRVQQDGAQLLDYLRNTPGTQITYDAAYTLTSNAPMIAFSVGTDGFGEVADGGELVGATGELSITNDALIAQRQAVARTFYQNAGFTDNQIADHLRGIDFNYPVTVEPLAQGTEVIQYQIPGAPLGNYYAPMGTPGDQLGFYTSGTSATNYVATGEVQVLRSTAASTVDDWSMAKYGWQIETRGGGTQFFTTSKAWVPKQ